jgi:hypothetical protein
VYSLIEKSGFRTAWPRRILIAVLSAFVSAVCLADDAAIERQRLYASYGAQLEQLAKACDAQSLARQAEFTRKWLPKRDPAMIYVFDLPESSAAPKSLVDSPAAEQWWDSFSELRRKQADSLLQLAKTAAEGNQSALAYEWLREAVRENPDLEPARKILGDEKLGDRWVSTETARRLNAGQVWSDRFGWQSADNLKRYDLGSRLNNGRWVTVEEDARLHSNIRNGWRVESDHYAVTTNHSLEEGAKLARRLEMLYDVWRQVFFDFYSPPGELNRLLASKVEMPASSTSDSESQAKKPTPMAKTSLAAGPRKPMQVIYFRDQQQYVEALKQAEPQIGMTVGFYSDRGKIAYFFAGEKQYEGTLFHEATHQLFRETKTRTVDPGRKNNYWIVEGVACYMESLATHQLVDGETYGQYYTVGGENAGRVPAARKRLVDDQFYVPLRELVAAGMDTLQHSTRLPMLYSQSTGLTFFLLHAGGAKYRPALNEYLTAVYMGRANLDTLEKTTHQRYEELDNEYREFLK